MQSLVIAKNGTASQAGEVIGQLQLVAFEDPEDPSNLTRISGAYYKANNPANMGIPMTSLTEMTSLIRSMRHFEANQKVIQAHDQRLGQTISTLTATQ